jgi:hypothetical protein
MSDRVVRQLKELNDYERHTFQLFITWYTFFVGVNYLALGWLATAKDGISALARWSPLIPSVFLFQNALGLFCCYFVWISLKDHNDRIIALENSDLPTGEALAERAGVPIVMYKQVIWLIVWSLVSIVVAWFVIFILLAKKLWLT